VAAWGERELVARGASLWQRTPASCSKEEAPTTYNVFKLVSRAKACRSIRLSAGFRRRFNEIKFASDNAGSPAALVLLRSSLSPEGELLLRLFLLLLGGVSAGPKLEAGPTWPMDSSRLFARFLWEPVDWEFTVRAKGRGRLFAHRGEFPGGDSPKSWRGPSGPGW